MMSKPQSRNVDSQPTSNAVAARLQLLLQDTYAAYLLTHNYHWNVEGPNFIGLHTLFEQQYTEMFAAIDIIAERIRALGAYALADDYAVIFKKIGMHANPLTGAARKDKTEVARKMIETLISLNEQITLSADTAKKVAEKAGDDETVDLTVERITVHQKSLWMLRSLLK